MFVTKSSNQEGSTCAIRGEETRRFSLDLLSKTAHIENFVQWPFITMNSRSNLHLLLELALRPLLGFRIENKKFRHYETKSQDRI